jgi:hypothetical protein
MKNLKKIAGLAVGALLVGLALTGCVSQSDTVSKNISTDAEYFKVSRQIVFYNGITDKYIAEVTGRCSVDDSEDLDSTLAVTCKVGPNKFIKDYLGKSDNVTWFALQTVPLKSDPYHYKVVFKPEGVIPDIRVSTSVGGTE